METVQDFRLTVLNHYRENGRSFPWRETADPYAVAISELMLQQTQTDRVVPKYEAFLSALPTWQALASVDTKTLLQLWQGLGYNRRALNAKRMAEQVVEKHGGQMPVGEDELRALPGIGPYTAGAVRAFAFNQPVVMIETNIRRAFLHHFFADKEGVPDADLFPLIQEAVDMDNPREWYYALMDYGSWLAKKYPNANRRSKHYTKQSTFTGSLRQLRGQVVRFVTKHPRTTVVELLEETGQAPERLNEALAGLAKDGFVVCEGNEIALA
ncbi:MAG TPA: A/G-specific adenine glycosylase [Verrucomicrobiae bacterium]|nr:A/G-specific adenine glycosylase [Verrucomicrobiae bacterium]